VLLEIVLLGVYIYVLWCKIENESVQLGFMLCSEMYSVPQTLKGNSILVMTERNPSNVHIATPKVRPKITL
jgi:hypothetical protein